MKTLSCNIIFMLLLCTAVFPGDERIVIGGLDGLDPSNTGEHYPILLALSGGGARGLASIGVIRAFEEKNITITAIAGTSMGGTIGGLYASGYSPAELSSIISKIDFNDFFSNTPERQTMFLTQRRENERHLLSIRFEDFKPVIPRALTGGQKITSILTELTTRANYQSAADFKRLKIPFQTVATDVVSGNEIVINNGSMAEAMYATMAFPLALTGIERDGQLLMDGGMVIPIPVEIVKSMSDSVSFVVAVNTASKLQLKEELSSPVDIAGQVTTIMTAAKLTAQLNQADYVIEPELAGLESVDFKHKDSLIKLGYIAGLNAADSIIDILKHRQDTTSLFVSGIEISGATTGTARTIKEELINHRLTRLRLIQKLKQVVREKQLFRLSVAIQSLDDSPLANHGVNLSIAVQEKLNVSELTIRITGNTIYNSDTLIRLFLDNQAYLTIGQFNRGLERIVNQYHIDGHDIAYIRDAGSDRHTKTVTIDIDEAIIHGVDIEENSRTQDWLVRSYFPLKIDEPYSTRKAAEGIDNIYGTGLFEQVTVALVPYRGGARVKIRVKEKHYTQLRLGWHLHDEYNSEQFIEIMDDNIRGMGLEYYLHAQYSEDRQKYFAILKMDRIWFTYITARITAYHRLLNRFLFDAGGNKIDKRKEKRTGFEISLGQQLERFGTVRGAFVLEELRNDYERTALKDNFSQRLFLLESLVETFDRLPFPTSGKMHIIEVRLAGKFLGGEVEYTRFFSSLEGYIPIGKRLNFHPKISIGISRSGLPPSEQFYLGGAKSFVGFRTDQLAGDKTILFNNELRFKLPLSLYLIGRYDFGEAYNHTDQIKLRNLRHGGGIFLSFDSPLGPFEFGYGIADSDHDRFYANIGLAF